MVLPCWYTLATLVIDPVMAGLARVPKDTIASTTATTTTAISTGTMGGNVHLALSSSSDMGICPASVGADGAAGGVAWDGGGGTGVGVSGIKVLLAHDT